jgi:epoxide hydrolase-like predicted phosphatase
MLYLLIMSTISAILFDIGGVIIRTDDPEPRLRLAKRFALDRAGIDHLVFASPAAQAAERGEADEAEVWEHVRLVLGLDDAGLGEFRREFWAGDRVDVALIERLAAYRPKYKVGLLTNAWSREPLSLFSDRYGLPEELVRRAFDAAVSSAQVGVQKPDPRAYAAAIEALGVKAGEAVFVDDFPHNIEAARKLGMRAILFQDVRQVFEMLDKMLGRQA